ncbi:MAG: dTDP-4-amino-4,6-dideoxygalactose transaminase [Ferruginibacter sp.]
MIFQNKPYITGREFSFIKDAIANRHLSGNGPFTNLCHDFFKTKYGFKKTLLTSSCTDALEMCAILLDIKPGDEVIMPSFTFVSTANAFILRGARIVLADSESGNPNIDAAKLDSLVTARTKAIVVVHYAGVACNMAAIMDIASRNNIFVIEDAAQAIDSFYETGEGGKKPLGSIGQLAAFSFHESKNIHCGEGGMLVVNDDRFAARAEIIWEKGTNRAAFFRGEVDKYNWVDVGSSFLPSEITAAFLYAQLLELDKIQSVRKARWNKYFELLHPLHAAGKIQLPHIPAYAAANAHIFYLVCAGDAERDQLIAFLKQHGVQAMFHYPGLHTSAFAIKNTGEPHAMLTHATSFSNGLLRFPLFTELEDAQVEYICSLVTKFYDAL